MAVLQPRPDDSSGRAFLKALRTIEQREPSRPFVDLEAVWLPEVVTEQARIHHAIVDGYMLHACEMHEAFLASEPPQMPRVSWSVYRGNNWDDTLVGGAAPTIVIAKARAEALWRAFLGYKRA